MSPPTSMSDSSLKHPAVGSENSIQNVPNKPIRKVSNQGKWYFGGLSSAMAASCTHPLDLLKVHLITQQHREFGLIGMGMKVVRTSGFFALYNGLSAAVLRQLTYSMTRFGLYETYKVRKAAAGVPEMPFYEKAIVSGCSGLMGGLVGTPAEIVNVRMQNDMKIPPSQRRNYKHALDGLIRICREEGPRKLFNGVTMTVPRAVFMTFGQLAFYDTFKEALLHTGMFPDAMPTYIMASVGAAGVATTITQPFDVMKTRLMNAKPGTYSGLVSVGMDILVTGPLAFFKGLTPSFIRLGPHMVLTFNILEQFKKHFGTPPISSDTSSSNASPHSTSGTSLHSTLRSSK